MTDTKPVIFAYRKGWHLVFHCSFCRRDHHHGVCSGDPKCPAQHRSRPKACTCPIGSGDGHRVAHCANQESPYRKTGYHLVEEGAGR